MPPCNMFQHHLSLPFMTAILVSLSEPAEWPQSEYPRVFCSGQASPCTWLGSVQHAKLHRRVAVPTAMLSPVGTSRAFRVLILFEEDGVRWGTTLLHEVAAATYPLLETSHSKGNAFRSPVLTTYQSFSDQQLISMTGRTAIHLSQPLRALGTEVLI